MLCKKLLRPSCVMLCSYAIPTQLLHENKSKEKLLAPETRTSQELCCTMQRYNAVFLRHSNSILWTVYVLYLILLICQNNHTGPSAIHKIINFLQKCHDRTTELLGWIFLLFSINILSFLVYELIINTHLSLPCAITNSLLPKNHIVT